MARVARKTQKVFAGNANADQIAVFGTMKTGTPIYSSDINTLQSASYTQGWGNAILEDKAPYLEEMNGVQYGLSQQITYILQQGPAIEYDINTTYFKGSVVAVIDDINITYYRSLTDNNIGNSVTDGINWTLDSISKIESYNAALNDRIDMLNSSVVKLTGDQTVAGNKTFSAATYAPTAASSTNNTQLATTAFVKNVLSSSGNGLATFVKGANGYIKFANGIIIQWGRIYDDPTKTKHGEFTQTLPVAFSSTNYSLCVGSNYVQTAGDKAASVSLNPTATTYFTYSIRFEQYRGSYFFWIAVGY